MRYFFGRRHRFHLRARSRIAAGLFIACSVFWATYSEAFIGSPLLRSAAAGGVVDGSVHSLDHRLAGGGRYRDVVVPMAAGDVLSLELLQRESVLDASVRPNQALRELPNIYEGMNVRVQALESTSLVVRVSSSVPWLAEIFRLRLYRESKGEMPRWGLKVVFPEIERRLLEGQVLDVEMDAGELGFAAPFDEGMWFRFHATQGQMLRFRATGGASRPQLTLFDGTRQSVGTGRALDASAYGVEYRAGESGDYFLQLQGEDGAYELQFDSEDGQGASPVVTLRSGEVIEARLDAHALQREHGQFLHRYVVALEKGEALTVSMDSADFDAYLYVVFPNQGGEENDDISPRNTNARVSFHAPTAGHYAIFATSYRPGESGAYTLQLHPERFEGGLALSALGALSAEEVLTPSQPVNDALNPSATAVDDGGYARAYRLPVRRGQQWRIELQSNDFDTYLTVLDGEKLVKANDDAQLGSTDSQVELWADRSTELRVVVSSFLPEGEGDYVLVATPVHGGASAAESAAVRHGRVVALMIGVSSYEDPRIPDLPYCSDDASRILDALKDSGSLAPESVILRDEEATVDAVRQVFEGFQQVVTPQDLLVVFFSGHGGQLPSADPAELDGLDETIVLRDGQIRDGELAEMVMQLDPRLTLVALDSCFSGGFRSKLLQRKNQVGIFSSEEDVSSLVAEEFRAGGYLAHILAEALSPRADFAPKDGTVTVDEMLQYIRREWARIGNVPSEDRVRARAHQNLVIERGYTSPEEPVWHRAAPLR